MRRARLVPVVAVAAALVGSKALAQTVTARVGGNLTGFMNTAVTVPVVVDMSKAGGAALGSYTARLSWNPAVLNCYYYYYQCGLMAGNFPAPQLNTDSLAQGVLRFTAISPVGAGGLVTLAQFQLEITDTTTSPLSLAFSEMSAAGTFTNLLPALNVSGGTFCTARGRWADLDNDGSANSRDALVILSNLVGLPVDTTLFKLSLGDADGDALVNSRDALIILSYAVGLDIPGQRVLLPAPTCSAGSPRQLAVFPATASLGPTQTLQLFVQAVDSLGQASAVPAATWRSSDYTVATVDGTGLVTPRGPGNATITADVAPGLRASAAITVLGRRSSWYVDLKATGAPLELGTATEPFEHPTQAMALAGEGDTIHVAPGTYYFTTSGTLAAGVVLMGGTPGDTTTRPVFVDPANNYTALYMTGGARTAVYNVAFDNFYYAADLNGVRSFALEDSKVVLGATSYGYGIYSCSGDIDSVRVDRSAFLGDSSQPSGEGIYLDGCGRVGLLTFRDSKIRFMGDGVYAYEVDSTAVIRSAISDNDGYGLYLTQENVVRPAVYLAHSRVERNYYEGLYVDYARRLVVDTTVVRATEDDGINAYGGSSPAQVYLHGDSIYQEGNAQDYAWLYTDAVDTLVVDRTTVRLPADTSFYTYTYIGADKAFVTNSQFLNLGNYSEPFYFYGSEVLVDNVDMTACAVSSGCDQAYGFELYSQNSVLNSEVRNSRFKQIGYPVYAFSTNGIHRMHGLQMDSVNTGIGVQYGDSAAVYDNVLTRVTTTGIALYGPSTLGGSVTGSSVTCVANPSAAGVAISGGGSYRVQGDTMTNCTYGIETTGPGRGTAQENVIRNGSYGIWQGYTTDTSLMLIRGNGISGTQYAAVYVNGRPNLRIVGNNLQNNLLDGVSVPLYSGYLILADSNAFVANSRYGVYAGGDSVNARYNWWGNAAGPGGGVADSVFGRVDATGFLTAAPSGLPGLAPPILTAARAVATADVTAVALAPAPRLTRTAKRPTPAGAASRMLPERQARLQRHEALRAEREARKAARQTAHAAEQQRRAQAAAAGAPLKQ